MELTGHYQNGNIKWKKIFDDGEFTEKILYSENGNIKERITFSKSNNGLADGKLIIYDEERLAIKNIDYSNGYPESDYRRETDVEWSGLFYFTTWRESNESLNGVECEKMIIYEDDGYVPIEQRYYAEGYVLHGKWIKYYPDPEPDIITLEEIERIEKNLRSEIEVTYDMGEVKEIRTYSEKGELLYKGNFQDGKLLRDMEYNEDGFIIYKSYFKDGNYHQQINEYDEDGEIDFIMNFVNGEEVEEI